MSEQEAIRAPQEVGDSQLSEKGGCKTLGSVLNESHA
jgi:hypothetical protein